MFVTPQVRKLRCTPWFDEWYRMRTRRGDTPVAPMKGLHEMVEGMHLLDWYRCVLVSHVPLNHYGSNGGK